MDQQAGLFLCRRVMLQIVSRSRPDCPYAGRPTRDRLPDHDRQMSMFAQSVDPPLRGDGFITSASNTNFLVSQCPPQRNCA
jgi:hypothetical protein